MNEFLTFGPPIEANVPFRILNWIHETCIITMITTNDSLQVARWSDIIAAADQIMSSCVTRYSWGGNVELDRYESDPRFFLPPMLAVWIVPAPNRGRGEKLTCVLEHDRTEIAVPACASSSTSGWSRVLLWDGVGNGWSVGNATNETVAGALALGAVGNGSTEGQSVDKAVQLGEGSGGSW
ncbi:hypothetical protein MMC21_005186 [Puttea exsequens]|nr:hypothetical protein [Puttea exsequens]